MKEKLSLLKGVAKEFLKSTDIAGIERTAWLEGYKHGIAATLSLDAKSSDIDLSSIKTLDQFEEERETLQNVENVKFEDEKSTTSKVIKHA